MTNFQQILPVDFSAITREQMIFAVFGYLTVICSLFLLFVLFSVPPAIRQRRQKKRFRSEGIPESKAVAVPGEASAAIALALSLYLEELHDQETSIITIKKAGKNYSPWNSKIYNVINFNQIKR
jgi:glutaconyl-CoA/methylmalonyl-CoA decarboxylase subunit delta